MLRRRRSARDRRRWSRRRRRSRRPCGRLLGDLGERDERWRFPPELRTVETRGLHKATDRCRLELVDVVGKDKLEELAVVLKRAPEKCLIFCNTVNSCRAAEHFLSERNACETFSYHGELNSREREASLKAFREGDGALVCTDLAARGLDIPDVDHVVMFDFPRNPVDYLHRAGRTARAGKSGKVTALVAKADRVLASAIQRAVLNGEPVDALSADKKAYLKGGALHVPSKSAKGRARRDLSRARKPKPKTRRSRQRAWQAFLSAASGGACGVAQYERRPAFRSPSRKQRQPAPSPRLQENTLPEPLQLVPRVRAEPQVAPPRLRRVRDAVVVREGPPWVSCENRSWPYMSWLLPFR